MFHKVVNVGEVTLKSQEIQMGDKGANAVSWKLVANEEQ
jgi:hypothetical protein